MKEKPLKLVVSFVVLIYFNKSGFFKLSAREKQTAHLTTSADMGGRVQAGRRCL